MNKQAYRIVFNQARGCLMAVAETASGRGKGASGERTGTLGHHGASRGTNCGEGQVLAGLTLACKLACNAVLVGLPLFWCNAVQAQSVTTQIVADHSAAATQRPTVLNSANGTVQVNIQTPSAAGVSRNSYSQFDVGSQGAVLNNSRTDVSTQLGGWVQGNPWLATGSARVILNEVNSTSPSQLQGYVEVAGQRAQVVIANPAGIAVNGAGFINASGVTLTTGTPVMSGGSLESYRVQRGSVSIDGAGLDTRSADYTAILSRAVQVNAGIWAQQLQVVTGANEVTASSIAADSTPVAQRLDASGSTPAYALDVAALGGMYAGKINLIGTEAGLGVRNDGQLLASSGPLTLSANGWLSNSGTLQASGGDVNVYTHGQINLSGTVYGSHNVQVVSLASQTHSGTVAALGDVAIRAKGDGADIRGTSAAAWAAGLNTDGQLTGQQNLSVQATAQVQTAGSALATNALLVQGASLDLSHSSQQAHTLQLRATQGDINATDSQILATDQLQLQTSNALVSDSARVQAGTLGVQARSLSNVSGQIIQTGSADQTIVLQGALNNTGGLIQTAAHHLDIDANSIDNTAGQLLHAGGGAFKLRSAGQLQNASQGDTQNALTDGARIVSTGDLHLQAQELINGGTMYAAGNQTLAVNNAITNGGAMAAAKDLTVSASQLAGASASVLAAGMAADGKLTGAGALSIATTGALQTAGQVLAAGPVSLDGSSLDLSHSTVGSTTGGVSIKANSGDILTYDAQVSTPGRLSITANTNGNQKLDNTSGSLNGKQLQIQVGQLNNKQGSIEQTGNTDLSIDLHGGALDNSAGRIVANAANVNLGAGDVTNSDGLILVGGNLRLDASDLSNSGTVYAAGSQVLSVSDAITSSGTIAAAGNLAIRAANLAGTSTHVLAAGMATNGELSGTGALSVTTTGALQSEGLALAAGHVSLTGSSLDLSGASAIGSTTGDVTLNATAGDVRTRNALVSAAGQLTIKADAVANQKLDNTDGQLSGQQLQVQTGSLDNTRGTIRQTGTGVGVAGIHSTGAVANNGGSIVANAQDLTLNAAGALSNVNGLIGHAGAGTFALDTAATDNAAGQILGNGALAFNSTGDVNNTTGLIRSAHDLSLTLNGADSLLQNAQGMIAAGHDADLSTGSLSNAEGQILAANDVSMVTANLDNTLGEVRAAQDLTLQSDGQITNDRGVLSAGRNLQVDTGQSTAPSLSINNQSGQIVADQSVSVRTGTLSGAGSIASAGNVSLSLQGDHTLAGTVQAGGNMQLQTTGTLINPIAVQAGQDLSVSAHDLDNQASGELLGGQTTDLSVAGTLTNRGLIDGADTHVQAQTVDNVGTGRLYGDRVAVAATTLNNREETIDGVTTAATIAGRERLDIGVQDLINREQAFIYSGGDMAIGGALDANWQASASAASVNNNSATIEAAQALSIQATGIRNTNEHFATEVQQISQTSVTEYQHQPGDVYSASDNSTRFAPEEVTVTNCEATCLNSVAGTSDSFVRYNVTRTVSESVVTESAPGKILAGQGIRLVATSVLNDKSQIVAGGALNVTADSLTNSGGEGTRTTVDAGTVSSYWRIRDKGTDYTGSSTSAYAPAPAVTTISLDAARYEQYATNASSTAAPDASTLTDTAGSVGTAGDLSALAGTKVSLTGDVSFSRQLNKPLSGTDNVTPTAPEGVTALSGSAQTQVKTVSPSTQLPTSSLFTTRPDPGASYLVETDPRFTQHKTWLGSDYMLAQLQFDPAITQKRLGDGFYEQRLIREQVLALTGQRFLGDYRQDDAQYQALMDNGLTYAREWNLRPGVALSAEQAAALTSDMVWLVAKDVTLADGSTQSVLVPQVYLRVRPGDVNGDGALLAGQDVHLNLNGDAVNSGTIAGRNLVQLNADNIRNLGGTISADQVALQASQDIDNLGGTIQAQSAAWLSAGRDLNLITTTQTSTNQAGANRFTYQGVDRVAGLYVSGDAGVLLASAGRDINLVAAAIANGDNAGSGPTQLIADNNINLGTVSTSASQDIRFSGVHYLKQSASQDVGTQINTTGTLNITAGQDLNTRAANVNAGGALNIAAGGDINLQAGQASQSLDAANQVKSSGFLNSRTLTTRETLNQTNALGSSLSGQTVNIQSGQDITVSGSSVVSDNGTTLAAAGNLNIEAAQETYQKDSYRQTTKSGLFSGGGLAVTIGTQQQSLDQQNTGTQSAASTIGAISGNVNLSAAQTYKQTGSDVLAPGGDINISAQDVQITEARESSQSRVEQKFKQSGLTLAITSPVISALQTVQQMSAAASQTSDSRMQALAAASAALAGYGAYTAIDNGQGRTINGKDNQIYTGKTNPDGTPQTRDATTADKVGGINLSISIGASSSQSTQTSSSDSARGSTLTAGGNIHIQASGAGADSDLLIRGSEVNAAGNVSLQAQGDITLQAAANTSEDHSNNSSRSGSIGISIGTNTGITASASKSKGKGDGAETTYSNTHVSGASVNIQSGADTTLQGAVVQGEQVSVNTGGNLTIQSLQDSASYQERSSSVGGSITVGAGFSGSINASKTKIDSDYLSVTEQSGIRAGDGGFQVAVAGDTTLTGGAITSSDAAVNDNLNRFSTGGSLATSDLQNSASYNASSASLGIGTTGGSAGIGSDKGSAASATQAAISGIAGNQEARTGDAETGINAIFDKERVQQEINAQVQITQAFGQQASKFVGDYAQGQLNKASELDAQARQESDPERRAQLEQQAQTLRDQWGEQGSLRVLAHAAIGGLTGGISGAAGAAAGTLTAPMVAEALREAGVDEGLAKGLTALASTAAGAAAGGSAGAVTAYNEVNNNYLSHAQNEARLKAARACQDGDQQACATRDAWDALDKELDAQLRAACFADGSSAECSARYADMLVARQSYKGKTEGGSQFATDAANGLYNYTDTAEKDSYKSIINVPHYDAAAIAKASDAIRFIGNLTLDLTPGVGDVKAFAEAETRLDYALAAIGALGPVGDVTKVLVKEAKVLLEAGETAKAAEKLAEAEKTIDAVAGRKGAWDKLINGQLDARTAYKLDNGHVYITDTAGRVKTVEGELSLTKMDRNTYQQCATGKCGEVGDDGGRLIASSLGGAGDKINIVPQASTLNRGDWKAMENELREALKEGKSVSVKIEVGYPPGGGVRPNSFTVTGYVDGEPFRKAFTQ